MSNSSPAMRQTQFSIAITIAVDVCSVLSLSVLYVSNLDTRTTHTDDSVTTGGAQPCHDAETTHCPSDQTSDRTLPSICCLCWRGLPFCVSSVAGVETFDWEGQAKRLMAEQVKSILITEESNQTSLRRYALDI